MAYYLFHIPRQRFVEIYDGLIIGRTEGGLKYPNDKQLSQKHVRLSLTQDILWIEDLSSKNETRINGKPIPSERPVVVQDGDHMQIGSQQFICSRQCERIPEANYQPEREQTETRKDLLDHYLEKSTLTRLVIRWPKASTFMVLGVGSCSLLVFDFLRWADAGSLLVGRGLSLLILFVSFHFFFSKIRWLRVSALYKLGISLLMFACGIFQLESMMKSQDESRRFQLMMRERGNCNTPLVNRVMDLLGPVLPLQMQKDWLILAESCRVKSYKTYIASSGFLKQCRKTDPRVLGLHCSMQLLYELMKTKNMSSIGQMNSMGALTNEARKAWGKDRIIDIELTLGLVEQYLRFLEWAPEFNFVTTLPGYRTEKKDIDRNQNLLEDTEKITRKKMNNRYLEEASKLLLIAEGHIRNLKQINPVMIRQFNLRISRMKNRHQSLHTKWHESEDLLQIKERMMDSDDSDLMMDLPGLEPAN